MLDRVCAEAADVHQAALLTEQEQRAAAHTWLTLDDNGDGTWSGRSLIADLHAHLLRTVLEHLSAPRRLSRAQAAQPAVDESAPTGLGRADLLGHAFAELIEHLPTDGWTHHGRLGATVMIHLDHDRLLDGLGAARLDSGAEISAGQARRMACNAGLIPAVLGGTSVPLDLGRQTRLFSPAQAAALSARWDTCAAEGCHRPFAWCELHHATPWALGGRTDLACAVPLCGWHHHRAHDPDYTHTIRPDGTWRFRRRRPAPRPGTATRYPDRRQITVIPADPTRVPTRRRAPARC